MRFVFALIATFALPSVAFAEEPEANKSGHTLFSPTPDAQMRELSTDRPDTTESPYSVDAGHVQFEAEPISFSRDKSAGIVTQTISSSVNAKIGLTNGSDLQLVFEGLPYVRSRGNETDTKASGIGDLTTRFKLNLWGNDAGAHAAALMPFITLPTHSKSLDPSRNVSGGLIVPFGADLPADWGLGAMLEVDAVRNSADDGYVPVFVQTLTVSHDIVGSLGGFLEVVNSVSSDAGSTGEAYFDAGITLGIGPDVQLDTGTNIGLSAASEDVRGFVGVSIRK